MGDGSRDEAVELGNVAGERRDLDVGQGVEAALPGADDAGEVDARRLDEVREGGRFRVPDQAHDEGAQVAAEL